MAFQDPQISPELSTTFRDYILLPRLTQPHHTLNRITLSTQLTENFPLRAPLMSAAMQAVSGKELAIALALAGGISVLPAGKVEPEEQVAMLQAVKDFKLGFIDSPASIQADALLHEAQMIMEQTQRASLPVIDEEGRLLGLLSERHFHAQHDLSIRVTERMRPVKDLVTAKPSISLEVAADILAQTELEALCLIDNDGRLSKIVYVSDLKSTLHYPEATRDPHGRLKVAAAISTHPEDLERAKACVQAGADALCIDASDGYSQFLKMTIEAAKPLGIPIIAGNVVDAPAFRYLAEAGADAIKIGIGSGSICTTRRVKAIGRGQATALRSVALARNLWAKETGRYLPLISDGGIEGTADMAIAFALGADILMLGKYFAGFSESPTTPFTKRLPITLSGQASEAFITVKPYWGEASTRAKNVRRYQQDDPRTFVIEGEEGFVLHKGPLSNGLTRDLRAIKSTLASCGCDSLQEFRTEALLERQTPSSQVEGGTSIFLS